MKNTALPTSFYLRSTRLVARQLIGKILCYRHRGQVFRGRIVETEAYLGEKDRAAHSFSGRKTKRVQSMYLEGGHAYVFMIYGMYYCLNIVTRTAGQPQAVLIRALEPIDPPDMKLNGPGKICREWKINKKQDGLNITDSRGILWVEEDRASTRHRIETSARIGIDYAKEAKDWPLRFTLKDNPHVSR